METGEFSSHFRIVDERGILTFMLVLIHSMKKGAWPKKRYSRTSF